MNSASRRAGVLFDLDETLIDRAASIRRYAAVFWGENAEQINLDERVFIDRFVALDGNGYVARPEFFRLLAEEFAQTGLSAEDIETHYFALIWDAPMVVEGAREGLRVLGDMGVPVGIVTNGGSANQRRKLANTGLGDLVDGVFISEELGVKKPAAKIFQAACRELNLMPDASWFVGDHPLFDICASHAQGLQSIWVRRSTPWPADRPPCYVLAVDKLMVAMEHLQAEFAE